MASSFKPLILFVFFCFLSLKAKSNDAHFQVEMIHRDLPISPFYNPTISKFQLVRQAVNSSFVRLKSIPILNTTLSTTSKSFTSRIRSNGEYLMKVYLGTQYFPVWLIVDTGSTLTWTQCYPCEACYKQKARLYNPQLSLSYKLAKCSEWQCLDTGYPTCGFKSRCNYLYNYVDFSYTAGNLATDRLSFLSSKSNQYVSFSRIYIGCGYANGGFFSPQTSGIFGLGNSPLSFIGQTKITKFSYCLPERFLNVRSKITFGPKAQIEGNGVVSTPLITYFGSFYAFTITGFRVGSTEIRSSQSTFFGNTIIDSGTTLTFLPYDLVNGIVNALSNTISCQRDYEMEYETRLGLCYDVNSMSCNFSLPEIVVKFNDRELKLKEVNIFIEVEDGVKCLALAGIESFLFGTWGNIAQTNFKIEYDLADLKLKFVPANCSKSG